MNNTPAVHTLGYEIVKPGDKANTQPQKLTRRFVVKEAAETALQLLKRHHPDAYLREIVGTEGIKGGKRFLRRSGTI